ncbi:hypothetical protein LK09_03245 [Microbacterium mangrovi]|uniref:PqqD family protein n=1 Tax=Microbacterium mangrovi TaxID=1348253 RepID=A0A0B2A8A0_9MICO|nr:hypothetical protein [Microbacterium mangrovi]KHK99310.1 hypothetical protein LK09_03245 [Microbacterium mangrovi]
MTRFVPGPGVASVVAEDAVYLAWMPDGPLMALEGPAALIWQQLLIDGDLETLSDRVSPRVHEPPDDLPEHVRAFARSLVDQGLLRPVTPPAS